MTLIRKKIYLIDYLKINIFIENDVINLEEIVIDSTNKKAFIRSCEIKISIEVRIRENQTQQRSIYIKKTITFSSRSQIIIFVYYLVDKLSFDRDFLFELDDIEFSLYVHLIDVFIKVVFVFNNIN